MLDVEAVFDRALAAYAQKLRELDWLDEGQRALFGEELDWACGLHANSRLDLALLTENLAALHYLEGRWAHGEYARLFGKAPRRTHRGDWLRAARKTCWSCGLTRSQFNQLEQLLRHQRPLERPDKWQKIAGSADRAKKNPIAE